MAGSASDPLVPGIRPHEELRQEVARRLGDQAGRRAIARAVDEKVAATARAFPPDTRAALRSDARAARLRAVRALPRLIATFAQNFEAHGGRVHVAADAAEARRIVQGIVQAEGAHLVAKSKSMTSEEVGLNRALADIGATVVETDLGERIVQLAGSPPGHIITPCIHMSREDIAATLARDAGHPLATDTPTLAAFARERLRDVFRRAEVGITGANALVAESGSVVVVENEGNARMVSTLPRCHIVLVGIEKVVATWEDLGRVLAVLSAHATGQRLTAYISVLDGPRRSEAEDGPEHMHVVFLDNGRSEVLAGPYAEALLCIRCGACLNVCPVFRQVGGLGYRSPYSGPVGAVVTPLLAGVAARPELPFLSTLCGACSEACPVGIPLHHQLLRLRREAVAKGRGWPGDRALLRGLGLAWATPGRYRLTARALSLAPRVLAPSALGSWRRGRVVPRLRWPPFRARQGGVDP
jgi:L-lactate dehydrogenase complex protein LldF